MEKAVVGYLILFACFIIACVELGNQITDTNALGYRLTGQVREIAGLARSNAGLTRQVAQLAQKNAALSSRLATDEHQACVIQSRGLRAEPYLVGSIRALHELLEFPPTAAERQAELAIPAKRLHLELLDFGALNRDSGRFAAIERKQPRRRSCTPASTAP